MGEPDEEPFVSPIHVAGRARFVVRAPADVGIWVEGALAALDTDPACSDPDIVFTVIEDDDKPIWTLRGPNCPTRAFTELDGLLDALVAAVTITALDADVDALHLHAAAACRKGRAVVIVGGSGSGKSTLVANLALSGWRYITDEMVRIDDGDEAVSGFPKPLSIGPKALDLLLVDRHRLGPLAPSASANPGVSLQLSPVALGLETIPQGRPALLLCSTIATGRRGMDPVATPISAADAVVRLMGQTMDAQRFGERALSVLAGLAARCACYDLAVGEPEQMVELVRELMETAPADPAPVRVVSATGAIVAGVWTAFIGDRAAIHEPTSGVVIALDPAGCAIWRHLGDMPGSDPSIDPTGPVVSEFVDRLRSLGLVRGEPATQS